MRNIDIKSNWSVRLFTPLDAEVEVNTGNGKKKRLTDLLTAIKKSNDRVFLVLGDPGSGKSVALRKLAQDLLKESGQTGKIPVYINLKEWSLEKKWDEGNPPTVQQLYDFVVENLKNRDRITGKFFGEYFDRLYENGRLYFILDSFDEIPSVLDERENSELIHQLSEIIFKFLKGARAESSQGILASRIFRKPTQEFQAKTILEIRPFTEEKIIKTLKQSGHYSEDLVHLLFKERVELVPVARNPFTATLISEYAEHNQNRLPKSQTEMYENYIENTLDSCSPRIEKRNLSKETIIKCAIEIADTMFQKYGLEAPINQLRNDIDDYRVEDVIDVLKYARLGRSGTGDENRFSFVHRRFTEYFAVQKIIADNREIDMESIPTDSQWRDALVLCCEVAKESKTTAIAEFCWDVIKTTNNPQDMRVIHCMRFLRDAFKGRLECIQAFRSELAEYIYEHINVESNTISVKLAVEVLGLLEADDIDRSIVKVIGFENSWLDEVAIKACRNLPKISKELERKLIDHVNIINPIVLFKQRKELRFSLSLSEGLSKVKEFLKFRLFDDICFLMLSICFPLLFAIIAQKFTLMFLWVTIFVLFDTASKSSIHLRGVVASYFHATKPIVGIFLMYVGIMVFLVDTKKELLAEGKYLFLSMIVVGGIMISLTTYKYAKFFYRTTRVTFSVKIGVRGIIYFIVLAFLTGTILLALAFLEKILGQDAFYTLIAIIAFPFAINSAYIRIKYLLLDFKLIRRFPINRTCSRRNIQETFNGLKLERSRLKFIKLLEANVKEVSGDWPDKSILNVRKEASFTRLAQLEEKWLGINR